MSAINEYPFDSWLRVSLDDEEYAGQVRSSDSAGVVVNIVGLGQRRVKHAEVIGPIEAPSVLFSAPSETQIPTVPAEAAAPTLDDKVLTIPLDTVVPFVQNPRQFQRLPSGEVDPAQHGLRQLAESIRTLGQQQPATVRGLAEGGYGLVDGERRFHALALAGIPTIRVLVQELNDADALAATVAASNHAEPYDIRTRARAVTRLLAEKRTQGQVAELLGIDQPAVSVLQRVFALPGPVQELIDQGKLRFGHVRYLVRDHLLQHPTILTRIAEIAAARDARVRDLEPEIPFEAELPEEMVKALRPQERLVLEETLSPAPADPQNDTSAAQDTNRVPHSSGLTETRTETNTVKTTVTTPAPAVEPPASYIDEEQAAWRLGRAAALRELPFSPPEDLASQWIAGWESVRLAPVDPKKQPVKTAAEIATEKASQQSKKPGALKTAEEKVAEQKGASEPRRPEPVTAVIPAAMADRLAELGGGIVPAIRTWCRLAELAEEHEIEVPTTVDLVQRFLAYCSRLGSLPDALLSAWEAALPADEEALDGE